MHAIINHIYDIGIKESDLVHTYIHTYIRRFCSKVVRAYAFISVVFFRDAHAAHTLSDGKHDNMGTYFFPFFFFFFLSLK